MQPELTASGDLDEISVFDLSEGIRSTGSDRLVAVVLVLFELLLLATMAMEMEMARTPPNGRVVAFIVAIGSLPVLAFARRFWRRAASSKASLQVSHEEIMVVVPWMFTEPLRLAREDVAAVVVDDAPKKRFAVIGDADWATEELEQHVVGHLWTKGAGGVLALVAAQARVPDLAILFAGARTLPVAKHISLGQPAPSRWPHRDRFEPGLMLCTGDADRLRVAFAGWPSGLSVHRDTVARAQIPVRLDPPPIPAPGAPNSTSSLQAPPTAPRRSSRRHASLRLISALSAIGIVLLAIVGGFAALTAATIAGRGSPLGEFLAFMVVAVLIRTLWPRGLEVREVGEMARPETQPDVWRISAAAAAGVGAPVPTELRLTLRPTISLSQQLRFPGRVHTTLRIGLPVLAALSEAELEVALASTLDGQRGHAALLINLGARAQQVLRRVMHMRMPIFGLAQTFLAAVFRPINDAITRASHALLDTARREGNERVCSRWPAFLLDGSAARMAVAQQQWDVYWHQVIVPALEANDMPAIAHGFASWIDPDPPAPPAAHLVANLPHLEELLLTHRA